MRQAAAGALGQLGATGGDPEVLTALLHALADPDQELRAVWLPGAGAAGRGGGDRRRSDGLAPLAWPIRT